MDDDSLSRRAADFTRDWVGAANAQRHQDALNAPAGPSPWRGSDISRVGVLTMAAVFGGLAGSLGGGDQWIASAALGAGLFVGLTIVVIVAFRLLGWTWSLGARSTAAVGALVAGMPGARAGAARSGWLGGMLGAVLRGGMLGAAVGAALAAFAGGDIPLMEGITRFAPAGALLAVIIQLVRGRRP